jgi:hypothetical protein
MLFLVAAVSALLLPSPADARDGRRSGAFLQAQAQQQADKDRDQYRRGRRDARRTEKNGRNGEHPDRLTDEERRELHRDLDRARREIYRRDRRR